MGYYLKLTNVLNLNSTLKFCSEPSRKTSREPSKPLGKPKFCSRLYIMLVKCWHFKNLY